MLSSPAAYNAVNLTPRAFVRGLTNERHILMKNSVQSLALAAAFARMIGGTTVRLNAQTAHSNKTNVQAAGSGVLLVQDKWHDRSGCSCRSVR
jgi:hypothetical protein